MAAPFFSYLNYKDSNYSQNDGYIENIQVTSDTGNLLSISWVGPNGFTSGPSSTPPPDLTNLEPGVYTGTVLDTLTGDTGTVEITITELPEVILNAVFDNSCIGTVNCNCVLDVLGFTHNSNTFKYDLYKDGVLVDTYYGSTGSEAYQFTGLCDGEYFLLATELDINVYTFNNPYDCDSGEVIIDDSLDVATIVSTWRRFAIADSVFDFSFNNVNNSGVQVLELNNGGWSGALPDNTIEYTNDKAFFYTGFDPLLFGTPGYANITEWNNQLTLAGETLTTRFIGSFSGGVDGETPDIIGGVDGTDAVNNKKYFYNLDNNKFVFVANIDFVTSKYGWITFQAEAPIETLPGDPLKWPNATSEYTTIANWNAVPIGTEDYTIDPLDDNKVKLASLITEPVSEKIQCAFNTVVRNGYYSDCKYITYTHEVTINSNFKTEESDGDDDFISILLARTVDDNGISHFLSLDFDPFGQLTNQNPSVSIEYNAAGFQDRDQSIYTFNNGETNINLFQASPFVIKKTGAEIPISGDLWVTQGSVRVRITRSGDQGQFFKIEMTDTMGDKSGLHVNATKDLGEENDFNDAYTIEFQLDNPATWLSAPTYANGDELLKFLGPNEFGYSTFSQPDTAFFHLNFIGEQSNTTGANVDELGADDEFLAAMPCGCPEGFVYNLETDECDIKIEESIICNPTTYTVESVNTNPQYTAQGAYFYEDASNRPLPLTRSQIIVGGTTQGDKVVRDGNGNLLAVQRIIQNNVWGNSFGYDPSIVTFGGPNNIDTGTPVPNVANLGQIALNGLSPVPTGWLSPWVGRMNAIGVWTNSTSGSTALPLNEWVGFTACVEVPTTKKYTIGISGDNWFRFKVDGQLYFDFSLSGTDGYQRWHVVELELTAGQHIIEFEGQNRGTTTQGTNPAALAAEIYDASSATLQTITTVEELEPLIVWSTADLIGEKFDSGEESGCRCPDGFTLSACDGELKCVRYESVPFVKCNCYRAINCEDLLETFLFTIDSSLPALDVNLIYKFDDPAGRANPDACYIIEEATDCDIAIPNLSVSETFVDCATCSGTCYSLTDCTNPENILYFDGLGAPELAQYVGQVISIYNANTEILTCTTVNELPCNQAIDPLPAIPEFITIQEEFCDCEECLPKPIEVPELEINNRTVKPGYDTPGCSPEYVEKISCNYSEALYQEVISRRYGIEFCCSKDLNSLDIKKQLMEFKMITDPDACKEIPSDCCPPCGLELELTAIPTTECLAPINLEAYLSVPPYCFCITPSLQGDAEGLFSGNECDGTPFNIVLTPDGSYEPICVRDDGQQFSSPNVTLTYGGLCSESSSCIVPESCLLISYIGTGPEGAIGGGTVSGELCGGEEFFYKLGSGDLTPFICVKPSTIVITGNVNIAGVSPLGCT